MVCRAFNLDDNDRPEAPQIKRGVAGAVMCVYDRCADAGRIDLIAAKLFVLLFERRYRSHGDDRFEYGNGSWPRVSCISAPALLRATDSIRYAQSVFALMTTTVDLPSRDFDGVSESDRRILDSKTIDDLKEISLLGKPGKKHARTFYCAELRSALFKSFTERGRAILTNFHNRGASPMPEKGAVLISQTATGLLAATYLRNRETAATRIATWPSPQASLTTPHPEEIRRVRGFLATTFSGSGEGLIILLAMQPLDAGAEILPEVILFFVGHGGDGKSLSNVTIASAIWVPDLAASPASCYMLRRRSEGKAASI